MTDEKVQAGFDALLTEDRVFEPPEEFRKNANINDPGIYERADADPEGSGPTSRRNSNGAGRGTRCSTGSRQTRSGS